MKTIKITVSPSGESRIETVGFVGDSCREASKFIEVALGKTASEKLKPEFHQRSTTQNTIDNSNEQV
ncbi:MAG: DUF2997 domain-containing protein [Pirellulaceae bacterium]